MKNTEESNVISRFSKFLDEKFIGKKKIETIEDLLELPIYSYRFLSKKEAKILEDVLDIYDIGAASTLEKDDPFKNLIELESTTDPIKATEMREKLKKQITVLKKKFPDLEAHFKKAIMISSLIQDIKDERLEIDKKQQKIVVAGLDNAGKTAILSKLGGKLGINNLASLKPTKGVDRKQIKEKDLNLFILDMGGQSEYRKRYMNKPENYFIATDLLLYVVDVQDPDKFDESFEYFQKIIDTLLILEECPYFLIFIHKYDPDLRNDPEIQLNVELLKDTIKDLFEKQDQEFEYEIYTTSIYSLITNEPKFSRYIKEVMKADYALTDPTVKKIEGLGKILEQTLNAVIKLSESLSVQLNNMDSRLGTLEDRVYQITQGEYGVEEVEENKEEEKKKAPPERGPPASVRQQVLSELKNLFDKKKSLM
ncbi:MAG: ADP-ribosylation factor-like protein [Promethearchaeia archaeon]